MTAEMGEAVHQDLAKIREELEGRGLDEVLAGLEMFVAVALRVFSKTNPNTLLKIAAHENQNR